MQKASSAAPAPPPPREDFVRKLCRDYKRKPRPPEDYVKLVKSYFKMRETKAHARPRKTSSLNTAQSYLSRFKKCAREMGAPEAFLARLCLSAEDMRALNQQKQRAVHDGGANLKAIPGVVIVLDCRDLLDNERSTLHLKIIAVAALSGRRLVEILRTATFGPPKQAHDKPRYWANLSGMAKQRGRERTVEIPLLDTRERIARAVREIRQRCEKPPAGLKTEAARRIWVSNKYAKPVNRAVKKYCRNYITKLHDFRKFYAAMAFRYFNEENKSFARFASDVLGHQQTSSTVLTYMNMNLGKTEGLPFPG